MPRRVTLIAAGRFRFSAELPDDVDAPVVCAFDPRDQGDQHRAVYFLRTSSQSNIYLQVDVVTARNPEVMQ